LAVKGIHSSSSDKTVGSGAGWGDMVGGNCAGPAR